MPEPKFTPPFGPSRPAMDLSCGRLIADGYCGKPATWHFLWTAEMDNGLCCDEHTDEAEERWLFHDRHPVEAFCTMDGSHWAYSWDTPPGHCVLPIDDEFAQEILIAHLEADLTERDDNRPQIPTETGSR